MYDEGNLVEAHVIPFARARGCQLQDTEILNVYLRASAGDMTSAALWSTLDVPGDATELDARYAALHRLTSGLAPFLRRMRARDTRVVCLSNDVSEWSRALRELHGLPQYIDHWTVSGDVASRKPSREIYRSLLQDASLRAYDCLFVDDKEPNLDVARDLGFHTCLFAPRATAGAAVAGRADLDSESFQLTSSSAEGSTHHVARTFDEVGALLIADADSAGT